MRPVYIVENNELKIKKENVENLNDYTNSYEFDDLVKEGLIEFLDVEEEVMIYLFLSEFLLYIT
jgi:DNA-directed RNA polymerase II subunit RPB2